MLNTTRLVKKGMVLVTSAGLIGTGLGTPTEACPPRGGNASPMMMGNGYGYAYPASYPSAGYQPGYAYPQTNAYQQPVYQQPVYQAAAAPVAAAPAPAPVAAVPPAAASQVADAPAPRTSAATSASGIVLMADKDLGGSIHYTIESNPYEMSPGQTQDLDGSRTWTIRFDRGGGFGQAEYGLTSGYFEWVVTERGWDLRAKTFVVTLDNSRNTNEFNFLLSDREETVAAGQAKKLTSKTPIVIVFDRGDGGTPARKPLSSGSFFVGLDPSAKFVDVLPGLPSTPVVPRNTVPSLMSGNALPSSTVPASAAALPPAPAPAPTLAATGFPQQ